MRRLLAATLVAFATAAAFGMPVLEPEVVPMTEAVGERITLHGTLNRFGNEPHTFLGVLVSPETPPGLDSTDGRVTDGRVLELGRERVFELEGDLVSQMNRYQGQRVTVRGVFSSAPDGALPPPVVIVETYTTESD